MGRTLFLKTIILLAFWSGAISCQENRNSSESLRSPRNDSSRLSKPSSESLNTDSIKRIIVDDYPVTDEMLDDKKTDNSSYLRKSGEVQSREKFWFTNNTLGQTLVFELYTDKHRLLTYHFLNNKIPNELIDILELHTTEGDIAPFTIKKKSLPGFIKTAININTSFFITNKGIKLGDSKKKVLMIYGKPDIDSSGGNIECLVWSYTGDILYDGKVDLEGKPLAKDNYGHQAIMYFEKNTLIGIILHNEIP
jgi:hypothetical protein